jgi:Predicted ATPase
MDEGIWSRVRLIPFQVTIPKKERDPMLGAKLRAEMSGILNWAIEGCLRWRREGLGEAKVITQATAAYRNEMDVLSAFVSDCCETGGEDMMTSKNDIYKTYQWWAERQGMKKPYTKRTVMEMLKERGFPSGKCKQAGPYRDKQVVYGLRVKTEVE